MTANIDLNRLLETALTASLEAGRKLLEIYRSDYSVSEKSDRSPITDGDLAADQAIVDILTRQAPDLPILSEEQAEVPYETRRDWQAAWVIDPLDGTKEFLKENGEFTTNIAVVIEGRPVLGVVYAPAVGTIYWGTESGGAFRSSVQGEASDVDSAERLTARAQQLPIMAASASPRGGRAPGATQRRFTIAASRSHLNEETRRYISWLTASRGEPEWITAGSAVKLCLVAEGSADVYPRLGTTMEWDTAAGDAVVRAAGAEVVAYATGAPLEYNKRDLRNPWFVVRR
jgi:3'(2'), 5'-bisphosphate nucleotidase